MQRTPSNFPDILESTSTASVVDLISHGPINGLVPPSDVKTVNGPEADLQSILINQNPIISADGNNNFDNILHQFNRGTETQDRLRGFTESTRIAPNANLGGGFEVTFGGPDSEGPTQDQPPRDYICVISEPNVDSAIVTIQIPQMFILRDGRQFGNEVFVAIHARESGTSVFPPPIVDPNDTSSGLIIGKVLSPHFISYRIPKPDNIPAGALWEVVVRKRNQDFDSSNNRHNTLIVSDVQEVLENQLSYENLAVAGLTIPQESVGNSAISNIEYDIEGMIVDVPSTYNTDTRTMGNGWDGNAFVQSYTNNPSFCLLSLITNEIWGMGIPYSFVDVFSFVEFANFCDEVLEFNDTNGDDVSAPRFSYNVQITDQRDPIRRLQEIAGIFRSFIVLNNGLVSIISDKRKDRTSLVTTSSTVQGFNYSFTDISQRTTLVRARFEDEELNFNERVIEERDTLGIDNFGVIESEIRVQGLTSEAEVRRHCRYILERTLRSTKLVTFETGMNANLFQVGDRIGVVDNDFINLGGSVGSASYDPELDEQSSGRTLAGSTIITTMVDRPINLGVEEWVIGRLTNDGSLLEADVTSVAEIDGQTQISHSPWRRLSDGEIQNSASPPHRQWYLYTANAQVADYEVVRITEDAQTFGSYTVVARDYRPESFSNIDVGVSLPSRPLSNYETANLQPPIFTLNDNDGTGFFPEKAFNVITGATTTDLRLAWQPASQADFISEYFLRWRVNSSDWNYQTVQSNEFTIPNAERGFYDIRLVARSVVGVESPAVIISGYDFNILAGATSSLTPPTDLRLKSSPLSTTGDIIWDSENLTIEFEVPAGSNESNVIDPLRGYLVEYESLDASDVAVFASHLISPASFRVQGNRWIFEDTLSVSENLSSFQGIDSNGNFIGTSGIQRNIQVRIYAQDVDGNRVGGDTVDTSRLFRNLIPVGTTFDTFVNSTSEIRVTLNENVTDSDLAGYYILKSEGSVPFGNATERLSAIRNGLVEVIHNDPSLRTFTSAVSDNEYVFYACPYDTLTDNIEHYAQFGNWVVSAVQQAPALQINIEEFTGFSGWDIRLDHRYNVATGQFIQESENGFVSNAPHTNHWIGVNVDQGEVVFNRADGDRILFKNFNLFSSHNFAASNVSINAGVDTGESHLYLYIEIPSDALIDQSRTLIDAGTNLYEYTGSDHRVRGSTSLRDAIGERQVIIASYDRDNDNFIVNLGDAVTDGRRIIAQTIGTNQLLAGGIDADRLVADSVTSDQIAANAISTNELQANAVTSSRIASNQITATHVGANRIISSSANIQDAAINTLAVAGNSVTTTFFATHFTSHLWKPLTPNNGPVGDWIHRANSVDEAGLIAGVGGNNIGNPITTSNMANFPNLVAFIPRANDIGAGNVDIVLNFSCVVAFRSNTLTNYNISSNFRINATWTNAQNQRITQGRALPDIGVASGSCFYSQDRRILNHTLKFSIPTNPNPNLLNVVDFRLNQSDLAFFNPTFGGGFAVASNETRSQVIRYGLLSSLTYNATMFLR